MGALLDRITNRLGFGRVPVLNEDGMSRYGIITGLGMQRQPVDFVGLVRRFESSPEAVACMLAIVEDTISDGYYLEGGRNQKIRAQTMLDRNNSKMVFSAMFLDALITGNGYIYGMKFKGAKDLKEQVMKSLENVPMETKSLAFEMKYNQMLEDSDVFKLRNFISIPSSTVNIQYDNYKITGFVQDVPNKDPVVFTPQEVFHFKLMELNGKVYGFTPFRSLSQELDLNSAVKDYAQYSFDRNSTPNNLFILKNEQAGSTTYKEFVAALKGFENERNRFKSLVVCTGPEGIETQRLNELNKDMEFIELKRNVTQVIVSVFGIPATRLPGLVAEQGVKGAPSEEGYWGKISHYQDQLEEFINKYILAEYDVKLRFNRTYKVNEIKEAQAEMFKLDTIFKTNTLLQSHKKMLKLQYIQDKLGIKDEQIEEANEMVMTKITNELEGNRQGFQTNKDNEREGTNKQKPDEQRKETQKNKI